MIERVLVRKIKNGAVIGCSKDVADRYVASGVVEIIPLSPAFEALPREVSHRDPRIYLETSAVLF